MEHEAPSFARLTQTPLLLPEQERDLAMRARAGDENARRKLIEANMRLVLSIAKHYRNRSIPFEDLVQEGAIGLMNAVSRFDPDKGYRFSTYATHWIRQTIGRALGSKARSIRLPVHVVELIRRSDRERTGFAMRHGREPSNEELAKILGVSLAKLLSTLQCPMETISLDVSLGDDEGTNLLSMQADKGENNPESVALSRESLSHMLQVLEVLPERERRVVRQRIGLDSEVEALLLRDIGSDLQLSRERVRQIEVQALKRLRQLAQRRRLSDLMPE